MYRKISATIIISFIFLFFLFLINLFIIPKNFEIPFLLLIGFSIIIIVIIIIFINYKNMESKRIILEFKVINESFIKIFLMILMVVVFFIPAVTFSDFVIDWNQINSLNYVRAIIFLIGCSILPGACIYNLIFSNNDLHKKFKVEQFFIKITFYPILSFTFIGISVLILDFCGLKRDYFEPILFLVIIFLFIFDLLIQNRRKKENTNKFLTQLKISKKSFFIIIIAISVIIIALSIHLSSKYIVPGDSWRSISYADYIGRPDTTIYSKFYTTGIYWGYISFGLGKLCGIPFININAMLFPFSYLFIFSIYLFMKSFLQNSKEIYAVLSTIFVATFSELFYIFNLDLGYNNISWVIFDGIFCFRYKSFAFILLMISMALFFTIDKSNKQFHNYSFFRKNEFAITFLSALLLLQSYIIYFIPIIPAFVLIFIDFLISKRKISQLRIILIFLLIFFSLFFIFDVLLTFFVSYVPFLYLFHFLRLIPPQMEESIFLSAVLIYSIIFGVLILTFIIYKISKKYFKRKRSKKLVSKLKPKIIFIQIALILSELIIMEIFLNILGNMQDRSFFSFYLHLFFSNIGFIGILGLFLSYFCYKENKRIFYILFIWFIFLFSLASLFIFIRWLNYPFNPPSYIPQDEYFYMMYWFDRIWYYSIIPLSMIFSIGLIKFIIYFRSKRFTKFRGINHKSIITLNVAAIIIFFSLSNTIIAGMDWSNQLWYIDDEDAQVIGWVSENIPRGSKILIDSGIFHRNIRSITKSNTYLINDEINTALTNHSWDDGEIYYEYSNETKIEIIDDIYGHKNVLKFEDYNKSGFAFVRFNFDVAQTDGYFEFFLRTTNKSKSFWIDTSSNSISFAILSNGLFYYNGTNYNKIIDVENNLWYRLRIDFESSNGKYMGLSQYNWRITINGTTYGDFPFWNNVSLIGLLQLMSAASFSNWSVYFDNFNFSWSLDFNVEESIFKYPIIIDYLKSENINYFIHNFEEKNYYKWAAEQHINIENELIPFFYDKILFEYQNLIVYTTLQR